MSKTQDETNINMFHWYLSTGTSPFEIGGAGTVYIESKSTTGELLKQILKVDNNGIAYPKAAVVSAGNLRHVLNGIYEDTSSVGGVTWLFQKDLTYTFKELNISGNAHVAILSDSWNDEIVMIVDWLWGDKTGVLHIGMNQTAKIVDVDVYLPVNLNAYK